MMMRIALYHPWLKEKGGAEKVVLEAAKRSEHNVTIFTLFYDEEKTFEEFGELDVREIGNRSDPGGFIDKMARFDLGSAFSKIPTEDFEVLIVSTSGVGDLVSFRNHDIPVVFYTHTPLRTVLPEFKESYKQDVNKFLRPTFGIGSKVFGKLEEVSYSFADHVFANSETTKSRILDRGLASEDKISVLNPGVDIEGNEGGDYDNYFLYPSRFRRYKRQELAIEAFEKADLENFELVLMGSAQEEDYVKELKEKAGEKVRFETDVSDKRWREVYRNCYSVLFLAEKEDWGIVPVEAGSYSKPVIAVDEGGPSESVVDGETGFLVEADAGDIAEKMELLANDLEKTREMGEMGRTEAEKYSWQSFIEKFDSKLEEIVNG